MGGVNLSSKRTSIVVLGGWNLAIFKPLWVAEKLFAREEELGVGIEISNNDFGIRFESRRHGARIRVTTNRIEVHPLEATASALSEIERVAHIALTELPKTPISALGVNFAFDLAKAPGTLSGLLEFPDDAKWTEVVAEPASREVRREFGWKDSQLNVSLSGRVGETLRLDVNMHYPIAGSDRAIALTNGKILGLYEDVLDTIKRIYDLTPGELS